VQFFDHRHDLMHKACGWMLREVGKRNEPVLTEFLDQYYRQMPRTMLRYAIERFSPEKRIEYMKR
jgi:3-methyladenine DNA glycosylase AlkD